MGKNKIQVIGSTCSTCKHFFNLVEKIAKELEIETSVEYIDDANKIKEIGALTSPALVINDKVIISGLDYDEKEIREILLKSFFSRIEAEDEETQKKCAGCSACGGGCH